MQAPLLAFLPSFSFEFTFNLNAFFDVGKLVLHVKEAKQEESLSAQCMDKIS